MGGGFGVRAPQRPAVIPCRFSATEAPVCLVVSPHDANRRLPFASDLYALRKDLGRSE